MSRFRPAFDPVAAPLTEEADRLLAEGADGPEVARRLGISEQTYYRWRNQFRGLNTHDVKRLRQFERENATLKRLLAEAELEKAARVMSVAVTSFVLATQCWQPSD